MAEDEQLRSYKDNIRREQQQQAESKQLKSAVGLEYHHSVLKLQLERAYLALQLHAVPELPAISSSRTAGNMLSSQSSIATTADSAGAGARAKTVGQPETKGEKFPTPKRYQNIDPAYFDQFDQGRRPRVGERWRPKCGLDDLPRSEQEKAAWVARLRNSMFDFSDVVDKTTEKGKADNGILLGRVDIEEFHLAAKAVVNAILTLYRIGKQSDGMADPTKGTDGEIDHDERNMTFTKRMEALCVLFKHSKKAVLDAIKQDVHLEYSCVLAPNLVLQKKCDARAAYDRRRKAEKERAAKKLLDAVEAKEKDEQATNGQKQADKKRARKMTDGVEEHDSDGDGECDDTSEQAPKRKRRSARASTPEQSARSTEEPRKSRSGRALRSTVH